MPPTLPQIVQVDHSKMKLGKLPARVDLRTLRLADYSVGYLPEPPISKDWSGPVGETAWGMLLNDQLGDCTIAAALHLVQCWAANAGSVFTPTDAEALEAYERIDGYNPADPSTDGGGVEVEVLNAWKAAGIGGRKILGYASVRPTSPAQVENAIALFGGIYVGVSLPVSAQTQSIWDYVGQNDGGVWGGHAIPIIAYDEIGLTCVTWGALKRMTWEFFFRYCDEAYAVLSQDFIEANGGAPSGFDLDQLKADLAAIA